MQLGLVQNSSLCEHLSWISCFLLLVHSDLYSYSCMCERVLRVVCGTWRRHIALWCLLRCGTWTRWMCPTWWTRQSTSVPSTAWCVPMIGSLSLSRLPARVCGMSIASALTSGMQVPERAFRSCRLAAMESYYRWRSVSTYCTTASV